MPLSDDPAARESELAFLAKRLLTQPQSRLQILQSLDRETAEELVKFMVRGQSEDKQAVVVKAIRKMQDSYRPENDGELWQFIVDEFDMMIPRVAVCEGHCAPFDFVADAYFERGVLDKLIIGNRGSGKTQLSGLLLGTTTSSARSCGGRTSTTRTR